MILGMVLIWSLNFVAGKIALRALDPPTLASFRVVLAALFMSAVYFFIPRPAAAGEADAAARAPLTRRDLLWLAVLGAFGVAGNQMLFTVGLNYTTVAHSSLIIGAGPITILLLARILKLELLTGKKLGGMLLCFIGVMILAFEKGFTLQSSTLRGDVITWLGSLSFCLYVVLGKRKAGRFDVMTMNLYTFLAGGLIALPIAVQRAAVLDWGRVTLAGWAGLLYMAMFASVLAYLIFYWALRHLAASRLAAFTYFQPVLATLLGVWLLDEVLTKSLLLGGALILVGVYLAEKQPGRPKARPAA